MYVGVVISESEVLPFSSGVYTGVTLNYLSTENLISWSFGLPFTPPDLGAWELTCNLLKNNVVKGQDIFYKNNNNRQCLQKDLINSVHGAKVHGKECSCWGLSANKRNCTVRTDDFYLFRSLRMIK